MKLILKSMKIENSKIVISKMINFGENYTDELTKISFKVRLCISP